MKKILSKRRRMAISSVVVMAVSALLTVVSYSLWHVGYVGTHWGISVAGGAVAVHHGPIPASFPTGGVVVAAESSFVILPAIERTSLGSNHIIVPFWLLGFVGALPFAIAWWRHSPRSHGLCVSCLYDLTGNQSGRCPECGAEVVMRMPPEPSKTGNCTIH